MREVEFVDKNNGTAIGYVYVVECEGHYKIGKTMTCTNRFYEYTKLFSEPILICCELVKDYGNVEKELHKMFAEKHTRGEWFILDDNDLCLIKKYLSINKANGNISFRVKNAIHNTGNHHISAGRKENHIYCKNDKYWSPKRKSNGRFIKIMEAEKKEVALKFTGKPATYLAFHIMSMNVQMNTNLVVREDGKKYRIVDLAKEMGITRQSASVHIKKLQEANLIAEMEVKGKGNYWVVNPNYCLASSEIPENVYRIFEKRERK